MNRHLDQKIQIQIFSEKIMVLKPPPWNRKDGLMIIWTSSVKILLFLKNFAIIHAPY